MFEIAIRKRLGEFELDVELTVPENQIIALFGPSGAGKSMTLASIAGFVPPDSGRIVVGTRVLFDSSGRINLPPQQRRIGLVKQDLALFPHLTVEENITYGLFREPVDTRRERAHALLHLMNLDDFAARYPAQLSGGQQQRVALARALAPRPDLLLLDEPFSALDAPTRMILRREVRELQREFKIPTVFVTHDLGEAYFLADQLAVIDVTHHHGAYLNSLAMEIPHVMMRQGTILQIGAPGEILRQPNNLRVARAVGVKNILPGEIVARDASGCRVRVGDVLLDAPFYPFDVRARVNVCLRPERIMLLRPERAGTSSDENALHGEIVREMSDGMTATLYFRTDSVRLVPDQDYDLQIELPVYIYERLRLVRERAWTVSLRKNAIHLIGS